MKRTPLVRLTVFGFLLGATGCGHAILVKGVDVAEARPVIPQGTSFAVEKDSSAEGETDRAKVARKIEELLEEKGHEVTSSPDADFSIRYAYEITPLLGKMSLEPIVGSTHQGIRTVRREGPFNHRLYVWVTEAGPGVGEEEPLTVWAGGGILNGAPTDSPRFLDLVLVATFEHFLEDTGETLETRLQLGDARAQRLREAMATEDVEAGADQ